MSPEGVGSGAGWVFVGLGPAHLEELDDMSHMQFSGDDVVDLLRTEYERRIEKERTQIERLELDRKSIAVRESHWARRHLLLTEKNHVIESYRQGVLSQDVYEDLLTDIDDRLLRLESGEAEKSTAGLDLDPDSEEYQDLED